jgi:nucleoside-diphosphate-sugar epimerase
MLVVSGASGMLGSQIVLHALLAGGRSVRGLYRRPESLRAVQQSWAAQGHAALYTQVDWHQVDLEDALAVQEALHGADSVIHAAAIVSFRKKEEPMMRRLNPQISENIWLAALDEGVRHAMHISSVATLSADPKEPFISESSEQKRASLNAYGQSKYDAEMVAWRYAAEGLSMTVVHPTVIVGPSAWSDGSSLFPKTLSKGLPLVSGGSTGWVDVRDVAQFCVEHLSQERKQERYLLNGVNRSFHDVFRDLALDLGARPPRWVAPATLLAIAWRVERLRELLFGRKPSLTEDSVRAACAHTEYHAGKATALGFAFRPWEETSRWVAEMHLQIHG